jgi:hypothetical protein
MNPRPNNGYPPEMRPIQAFVSTALRTRLRVQAAKDGIHPAEIIRAGVEAELERREFQGYVVIVADEADPTDPGILDDYRERLRRHQARIAADGGTEIG